MSGDQRASDAPRSLCEDSPLALLGDLLVDLAVVSPDGFQFDFCRCGRAHGLVIGLMTVNRSGPLQSLAAIATVTKIAAHSDLHPNLLV
jgi:hypothetical protein